jgi:hypothetical protein
MDFGFRQTSNSRSPSLSLPIAVTAPPFGRRSRRVCSRASTMTAPFRPIRVSEWRRVISRGSRNSSVPSALLHLNFITQLVIYHSSHYCSNHVKFLSFQASKALASAPHCARLPGLPRPSIVRSRNWRSRGACCTQTAPPCCLARPRSHRCGFFLCFFILFGFRVHASSLMLYCLHSMFLALACCVPMRSFQLRENLGALAVIPRLTPQVVAQIEACMANKPDAERVWRSST